MTRSARMLLPTVKANYWMLISWLTRAVGQCRLDRGPDDYISPLVRLATIVAEQTNVHFL